jgi:phosphoribulokinase
MTVTIETQIYFHSNLLHVLKTCTSISVKYQNESFICSIFRSLTRYIKYINDQQIHFKFTDVLFIVTSSPKC